MQHAELIYRVCIYLVQVDHVALDNQLGGSSPEETDSPSLGHH